MNIMSAYFVLYPFIICLAGVIELKSNDLSPSLFVGFKKEKSLLWLAWFSGILLGLYFFCVNQEYSFSVMRRALIQPLSIVSLVVTLFLPLVIYCIPVPFVVYLFVTCKGFGIIYLLCCIRCCFADTSLFVTFLYLFSDLLLLLPTLYLCTCRITAKKYFNRKAAVFFLATAFLIGSLDFFFISPFLSRFFRLS